MKRTAELPVAESVKLCIELDEYMEEQWEYTRGRLEDIFRFLRKPTHVTDDLLIQCLLYCFEKGEYQYYFADEF